MNVTIETSLINHVKYGLFSMAYVLIIVFAGCCLIVPLHLPVIGFIVLIGGLAAVSIFQKIFKKPFVWNAIFVFSDDALDVSEYNRATGQMEKTQHISYNEIASFYIFTSRNNTAWLNLYLKNKIKLKYKSIMLSKTKEKTRINDEAYKQFAQYNRNATAENKIQFIPSELATRKGKINVVIFSIITAAWIALSAVYKLETLPLSICTGIGFLFGIPFILLLIPGRIKRWKKISE